MNFELFKDKYDAPGKHNKNYWNIVKNGEWEPNTFKFCKDITNDGIFLDIGAWIGSISLYASFYHKKVICLEPDNIALKYLYENVKNIDNIEVLPIALSSETGKMNFTFNPLTKEYGDSTSRLTKLNIGYEVNTINMKDLIHKYKNYKIDAIKIDIEGGEEFQHLTWWKHIKNIPLHFSLHPGFYENIETTENIMKNIKETYYNIEIVEGDISSSFFSIIAYN